MDELTSTTTIVVNLWQLIGFVATLLAFFGTCVWAFAKMLIGQMKEQLSERFEAQHSELAAIKEKVETCEADLMRLRVDLPSEYVRREDWIRFSGTIDTKLDWLRSAIEQVGRTVAARGGFFDGR